jgi:hypothetical protein
MPDLKGAEIKQIAQGLLPVAPKIDCGSALDLVERKLTLA